MNVVPIFIEASFDDLATRVMGEAFDRACLALEELALSQADREIIAKRIIAVARTGERNADRLCEQAVSVRSELLKAYGPRLGVRSSRAAAGRERVHHA